MADTDMVEVDELMITGELNGDEFNEYIIQLPEFHEIRKRTRELAEGIVKVLEMKLSHYIKNSFTDEGGLKTEADSTVLRLFFGVEEIIESQYIYDYGTFRNGRLEELRRYVEELLTAKIAEILSYPGYSDKKEGIGTLLKALNESSKRQKGTDFSGISLLLFLKNTKTILVEHWEKMEEMTEADSGQKTEEELEAEVAIKFQFISELASFRKVTLAKKKLGPGEIHVFGDELEGSDTERFSLFCNARIVLDPSVPYGEVETFRTKGGRPGRYHHCNDAAIEVDIDRSTGELKFPMSAISLSHAFKRRIDYLKLQNAVLTFLLEYLESKPEDIEEYLVGGTGLEQVLEQTAQAQETVGAIAEESGQQIADIVKEEESVPQLEPVQPTEQPKEKSACTKFMRGLKGDIVMRALTRLLGEPIRSSGSHYTFGCKDGKTYPISIHQREDVGIGLLRKCLKRFGVTPEEFASAM